MSRDWRVGYSKHLVDKVLGGLLRVFYGVADGRLEGRDDVGAVGGRAKEELPYSAHATRGGGE